MGFQGPPSHAARLSGNKTIYAGDEGARAAD